MFRTGVSDRFYSSLYRKLLEWSHLRAQCQGDAHARLPLLLSIVHKACVVSAVLIFSENESPSQADTANGPARRTALVKRLLQIALHDSPAFAAATLVLTSHIVHNTPVQSRTTHASPAAAATQHRPHMYKSQLKKLRDEKHKRDVQSGQTIYEQDDNEAVLKFVKSVSEFCVFLQNFMNQFSGAIVFFR